MQINLATPEEIEQLVWRQVKALFPDLESCQAELVRTIGERDRLRLELREIRKTLAAATSAAPGLEE